jgi:hypothetical protein
MNPGARPKSIDVVGTEIVDRPIHLIGVYQLEGDTLTISVAVQGKPRPKDFEWIRKPDRVVHVFNRAKIEKKKMMLPFFSIPA